MKHALPFLALNSINLTSRTTVMPRQVPRFPGDLRFAVDVFQHRYEVLVALDGVPMGQAQV